MTVLIITIIIYIMQLIVLAVLLEDSPAIHITKKQVKFTLIPIIPLFYWIFYIIKKTISFLMKKYDDLDES